MLGLQEHWWGQKSRVGAYYGGHFRQENKEDTQEMQSVRHTDTTLSHCWVLFRERLCSSFFFPRRKVEWRGPGSEVTPHS